MRLKKAKVQLKRGEEGQKEGTSSQVIISSRNKQQVTRGIFSKNISRDVF